MSGHKTLFIALTALAYAGSGCGQKTEKDIVNTPEVAAVAPSPGMPFNTSGIEPIAGSDAWPALDQINPTTFVSDSSITEGETYGVVVVKGRNTTLTVSGGSIAELIVNDASEVSVGGGIIKEMYIYDNCRALITGGKIHTVSAYGKNTITLRGKADIRKLQSYGASKITVASSDASIDTVQYFTKCGCVDQDQNVKLKLGGGRFGSIGTGSTEVALNITGHNLSKSAYGGKFGYGVVKGRWQDGTAFSIDFTDKSTFSHTDLYDLRTSARK